TAPSLLKVKYRPAIFPSLSTRLFQFHLSGWSLLGGTSNSFSERDPESRGEDSLCPGAFFRRSSRFFLSAGSSALIHFPLTGDPSGPGSGRIYSQLPVLPQASYLRSWIISLSATLGLFRASMPNSLGASSLTWSRISLRCESSGASQARRVAPLRPSSCLISWSRALKSSGL